MQELEKILEEIDQEKKNAALSIRHTTGYKAGQIRMAERIEEIIRKHMNDSQRKDTFEFDFSGVKSFDCQCGRHYVNTGAENNDGWISVDERLPNGGIDVEVTVRRGYRTIGYYNELYEEWYSTDESGLIDVIAWKEPSEPYRPERRR